MREKKILMLIMAILLLLSNFTAFAGNPNPVVEGTEFTGSIDDVLSEGTYWVKDEPPHDGTLPLGNGHEITLDYNDCNTNVTWSLNDPADPDYEITIKVIYVKASDAYVEYPYGLDDGSKTLWSVAKECKDDGITEDGFETVIECDDECEDDCDEGCGFHQVSHVTIVYEFTEIEKLGSIRVCKVVDGEDVDTTDFYFRINRVEYEEPVSEEECLLIEELPFGEYYFTEIVPSGYKGIVTTDSVIISERNPDGEITFENEKDLQGTLIVEKHVHGDLANHDDEFLIRVKDLSGATVTGGAVSQNQPLRFDLPVGTYVVEETGYGDYTPWYLTVSAIVESATTETVIFNNDYYSIPPGPGTLIVEKYVYGEGSSTTDEFLIRVKNLSGETVTGGAVRADQPLSFELPIGEYVVEETGYAGYTPRYLTVSAIVEEEATTTVAFHNDKNQTPPGPGTLIVEKYVYGEGSSTTDEFLIRVKNLSGETVTGGAVTADQPLSFELPIGEYVVEETGYAGYTPRYLTVSAIVEEEATTTVAFHNDKNQVPPGPSYVYVFKEFTEGTAVTDMAFDFRIATDESLTGEAIVVSESVSYYGAAGPFELDPGTYYLGEIPYDGWEVIPDQMFVLGEEETLNLTLTNTAIDDPECHMTIVKKVNGQDSVRVKRNVEVDYTVEFHNDGDMPLWFDFWDSDGEDISITETSIYLEVGATTERAFTTSYSSTGDYENVATATYCCGYCDDFYDDYDNNGSDYPVCYQECKTITDSAFVEVYYNPPDKSKYRMKITKEADSDEYEVGDMITYTITVENTGNKTLTDIEVTDPMLGFEDVIDRLPYSGEDSVEFTVTYEATEEGVIDNTAYAKDDRAPDVEDDETVIVKGDPPRDRPGLAIDKSIAGSKQAGFKIGDQIWFNLLVTNTGETDLENIEVRDPFGGYFTEYVRIIPVLKEGDSLLIQDAYMIVSEEVVDFDNVATATTGDLMASDFAPVKLDGRTFIDAEDEIPLSLPEAGVSPMFMFYGLAALASGLGLTVFKKK